MKVLVTGAGGFIGSHLIERLAPEHEVYALARHPLDLPGVRWIAYNLTQPLEQADLPRKVDAVIHLAQSRHYREFPEQAADIYNVNVQATFALLEYARKAGAGRFVFASSGGVYGHNDEQFVETDRVAPLNFYLTSKYMGELLVSTYRNFFHTLVCRFFFVYGTRQNPVMLIPRLIHSVRVGHPVILQGDEGIRLNPINIADAVEALVRTLALEGDHIINIAGSEILTLREIANTIAATVGREPVFTIQADIKPKHLIGDTTKMRALLSAPRIRFNEGITPVCDEIFQKITGGE